MQPKVGVLFLHGIGRTESGYSGAMQRSLATRFEKEFGGLASDPASEIVFEEVNWSDALQSDEDLLWTKLETAGPMRYAPLRHFMLDFAADAIAYQPTQADRSAYDAIHLEVAAAMRRLAERAGEKAPLCIVAHSLGTVIASNYVYDLTKPRGSFLSAAVRARIGRTPMERGETLGLLYTMGSPIALWSLRYPEFGEPIPFPPRKLARHYPTLAPQWVNFYDPDDVIGYPLKPLNSKYAATVTEDRAVNVGGWLRSWNPMSHAGYWSAGSVAKTIGSGLARAWRASRVSVITSMRLRRRTRSPKPRAAARP